MSVMERRCQCRDAQCPTGHGTSRCTDRLGVKVFQVQQGNEMERIELCYPCASFAGLTTRKEVA